MARPLVVLTLMATGLPAMAVTLGACLDDLAPPLACPPPAPISSGDCSDIVPPLTGCLPAHQRACFAGERTSCACLPSECEARPDGCFPAPDCPPAVSAVAADAECLRVEEEHFGTFGVIRPGFDCTCGCTSCLSVCDGRGPTFGAVLEGDGRLTEADFMIPLLRIDELLPPQGRLGIYVRLRNLDRLTVQIFTGDIDMPDPESCFELSRTGLVPAAPDGDFFEHILYQELLDEDLATKPLVWDDERERPSLVAMLPPLDERGFTLVEIDCIIPFVVR